MEDDVVISTSKREPRAEELLQGLWIDRFTKIARNLLPCPNCFRCLKMYAAVAVLEGEIFFEQKGKEVLNLTPGDVILHFPDTPIRYWGNWTSAWIVWNGPEADKLCRAPFLTPESPIISGGAAAVLHALDRIREHGTDGYELENRIAIEELVLQLYRIGKRGNRSNSAISFQRKLAESGLLSSGHFLTVKEMAEKCGMCDVHFRRQFKAVYGVSPSNYFSGLKLVEARKLLEGGYPVKEISERLGFCNEFHFRRKFRKTFGYPPGQYLKLQ